MSKSVSLAALFLAIASAGLSIWSSFFSDKEKKIAYVNNDKVFEEYQGFSEGRSSYQSKVTQWQSNEEILVKEFESLVRDYEGDKSSLSESARIEREGLLYQKQQQLELYRSKIHEQMVQEDKKLTDGIVHQIDSYVQEYGKLHGYDYILGVNRQGNLLYAREGDDITEDLLSYLNEKYSGK